MNIEPSGKKRGRKSKKTIESEAEENLCGSITLPIEEIPQSPCMSNEEESADVYPTTPTGKKRGRKPKGGKIIHQYENIHETLGISQNVILHLKCSMKDLETNELNTQVESFNFSVDKNKLICNSIEQIPIFHVNSINNEKVYTSSSDDDTVDKEGSNKEICKKLKQLEHNLHSNNICDKKSSCFWCTYEFDNPAVYIPKHFIKGTYHVYGCFCSPECGVAYLMEENIDSSSKFERYYLLNNIYSKIYNYNKNIKPAPNPYYMLNKYYGNLTIQEYRSLLSNERLFFVVDKPLTRVLPELHEDNDDFIINHKIIPSNTYGIQRKSTKTTNKNNIVTERFSSTK